MALVDKKVVDRIPIPHEPDQWVELTGLNWADKKRIAKLEGPDAADATIKAMLVGWSYGVPLNAENIDKLDHYTLEWLAAEIKTRLTRDPKAATGSETTS